MSYIEPNAQAALDGATTKPSAPREKTIAVPVERDGEHRRIRPGQVELVRITGPQDDHFELSLRTLSRRTVSHSMGLLEDNSLVDRGREVRFEIREHATVELTREQAKRLLADLAKQFGAVTEATPAPRPTAVEPPPAPFAEPPRFGTAGAEPARFGVTQPEPARFGPTAPEPARFGATQPEPARFGTPAVPAEPLFGVQAGAAEAPHASATATEAPLFTSTASAPPRFGRAAPAGSEATATPDVAKAAEPFTEPMVRMPARRTLLMATIAMPLIVGPIASALLVTAWFQNRDAEPVAAAAPAPSGPQRTATGFALVPPSSGVRVAEADGAAASVEATAPAPVAALDASAPAPVAVVEASASVPVAVVAAPTPAPVAAVETSAPVPVAVVPVPAPVAVVAAPVPAPVATIEPPTPAPVATIEPPTPAPVAAVAAPAPAPVAMVEPPAPAPVVAVAPPTPAPVAAVEPRALAPVVSEPPTPSRLAASEPTLPAPLLPADSRPVQLASLAMPVVPAAAMPEAAPAAAVPAPPPFAIRARADTWLEVRGPRGESLIARVLKAGEEFVPPAVSGLRMTTGNAGGTEVLVNGTPAPSLGPTGVVKRNLPLDTLRQ